MRDVGRYARRYGRRRRSRLRWHRTVRAFARVNLGNDLYETDDPDDSPTELVLDEFLEALARIHLARAPHGCLAADDGLAFARSFSAWVHTELLPHLQAVVRAKKKLK